jgi:hypothetical protein
MGEEAELMLVPSNILLDKPKLVLSLGDDGCDVFGVDHSGLVALNLLVCEIFSRTFATTDRQGLDEPFISILALFWKFLARLDGL